jgi:hypothetical protein
LKLECKDIFCRLGNASVIPCPQFPAQTSWTSEDYLQ